MAENFDGHDSKNPWIYEFAPAHHLSLTEAAKRLGVKASRLRAMLVNMPGSAAVKVNTFNTVTQAQCDVLSEHLGSALHLSQVLDITGLTKSVLTQLVRVGLLPNHERKDWDLNVHKPFDVADVQAMRQLLFDSIQPRDEDSLDTIGINALNKCIAANRAVVDEVFEKIADGTLKAVNTSTPERLCDLVFDRDEVTGIIGHAHDLAMMTAEQLSRMTGWKSECIRH